MTSEETKRAAARLLGEFRHALAERVQARVEETQPCNCACTEAVMDVVLDVIINSGQEVAEETTRHLRVVE